MKINKIILSFISAVAILLSTSVVSFAKDITDDDKSSAIAEIKLKIILFIFILFPSLINKKLIK